jgi:hypothetical protein
VEREIQPLSHPESISSPSGSIRQAACKAFAKSLFDETGGQPLYLIETIKSLLESEQSKCTYN